MQTSRGRWQRDSDGVWLCFLVRESDAVRTLESMEQGKPYDLTVKRHAERRSLDANAYMWVLLDRLAEATHIRKEDIYRHYIKDIGGNSETVCVTNEAVKKLRDGCGHNGIGWVSDTIPSKIPGCTNVILYYGSSTYDTRQMSRLIDLVVDDCKDNGIETLPPEKLAAMVEKWGGRDA